MLCVSLVLGAVHNSDLHNGQYKKRRVWSWELDPCVWAVWRETFMNHIFKGTRRRVNDWSVRWFFVYAWFYLQNTDCIVFSSLVDLSQPSISL